MDLGIVKTDTIKSTPFIISNIGTKDLTLNSIMIIDTNNKFTLASEFTKKVISPQSEIEVMINFQSSAGIFNSTIVISNDDSDNPSYLIHLTIQSSLELSPKIYLTGQNNTDIANKSTFTLPNALINEEKTYTFSISNKGTALLTINSIVIDSATANVFTLNQPVNTTLNPDFTTLDFSIKAIASVAGIYSASINISSNDPLLPIFTFNLSFEALNENKPIIAVDTNTLDFGGVVTNTSLDKAITITNNGTSTLTISDISFSSVTDNRFSITSKPISIEPDKSQGFIVRFSPIEALLSQNSITISSNDMNTPFINIDVKGNGINIALPKVQIKDGSSEIQNNSTLTLGSLTVGSSKSKILSLFNSGTANLILDSILLTKTDTDFACITTGLTFPLTIQSNTSITFTIIFTPSSSNIFTNTLTIVNNDNDENPFIITLSGTGTTSPEPEITINQSGTTITSGTSTIQYPASKIGVSTYKQLTIQNTGTALLTLNSAEITGSNLVDFYISPEITAGTTIETGMSISIDVYFKPLLYGDKIAQLNIVSDDSDESNFIINLSGTGNGAPSIPLLLTPATNATDIIRTPVLTWQPSSDPENETVTYDIYLGTESANLPKIVSDTATTTTTITNELVLNTLYYWRVTAKDTFGNTTSSAGSFTTETFKVTSVTPLNNATGIDANTTITVTFNDTVKNTGHPYFQLYYSYTSSASPLYTFDSDPIPLTCSLSPDGRTVTITPNAGFLLSDWSYKIKTYNVQNTNNVYATDTTTAFRTKNSILSTTMNDNHAMTDGFKNYTGLIMGKVSTMNYDYYSSGGTNYIKLRRGSCSDGGTIILSKRFNPETTIINSGSIKITVTYQKISGYTSPDHDLTVWIKKGNSVATQTWTNTAIDVQYNNATIQTKTYELPITSATYISEIGIGQGGWDYETNIHDIVIEFIQNKNYDFNAAGWFNNYTDIYKDTNQTTTYLNQPTIGDFIPDWAMTISCAVSGTAYTYSRQFDFAVTNISGSNLGVEMKQITAQSDGCATFIQQEINTVVKENTKLKIGAKIQTSTGETDDSYYQSPLKVLIEIKDQWKTYYICSFNNYTGVDFQATQNEWFYREVLIKDLIAKEESTPIGIDTVITGIQVVSNEWSWDVFLDYIKIVEE
ncbi:MAG: hypothetical protein A2355_07455 [Spirochaetes bacterium RIFOXYB1_FULL_32_8]|nr:MAG: hypothetical protein A2355_07455 [Spirochaetes bacterium RIFOXYB1_FULL_32_8]